MKIFVMPAIFPREDNKQCGIYIYEQCQVLREKGHELIILDLSSYGYKMWKKCNKPFEYFSDVGKVYVNHTKGLAQSRLPRLAVHTYMTRAKKLFKNAIKECGTPDLIYAHFTFPCGYAARYFSKKYNIPYAVEEHYSLFLRTDLPKYLKQITRKTVEDAAAYFCVSQRLRDNIENFTGVKNKIAVVNNLVNGKYRYLPLEEKENFVFFAAGNLVKSKKFDLLIEAFSKAFSKDERVELRIAGAGCEEEKLKNMIKNCGANIKMLGRLDTSQMIEEYKNCNCFVLLSEYETFGIVYREAMASGRPIITVRNGGSEENWSDDFGIMIDKNNLEQSVKALSDMVENYSKYNLCDIAEKTQELYSGENIYKLIKEQFDKIKL